MKILQIHNQYLTRAGEDASIDRIHHVLETRHTVYTKYRDSQEWKRPGAPPIWKQPFLIFRNPLALQRLKALNRALQPDLWLIHNPVPVISLGIYDLARSLNVKVVQFLHNYKPYSPSGTSCINGKPVPLKSDFREISAGTWQHSWFKTALISVAYRQLRESPSYKSIHRWIAISDFQKKIMVEAGLPEERVHRLYHSWDLPPSTPPLKDGGYYLFLGRLIEEKGILTLIEAWKHLQERGDRSRLIICGEGSLVGKVREACAHNHRIEFHGSVRGEIKAKLLAESRGLIAPSLWWEPLGLIVYEAYTYQKPVFAARSGGLQETVIHQKTGFLHQPGNAQELAEQILHHNQNLSAYHTLGIHGKQWLRENTNVNHWLDEFERIVA